MPKPDLEQEIITSEEARTFLQMVTKGFYNQSYTGLWIYEVIGREWDELRAWAEGLKDEIFPQTCTWSIAIWEWVYGIEPDDSLSLEFRRQRILSRIRSVRPINPEAIRRGVAALIGADVEAVEVNDFVGPYRFEVVVHPQETPFPYNRINPYIREIKPSHLAFETTMETKVEIRVLISTDWNLMGFGLTGQYNAGTRPNTNFKARLHDILIDALVQGKGAPIPAHSAGTYFATAPGTDPQRMPSPSTMFRQVSAEIDVLAGGKGFTAHPPQTAEERSETGRYPGTHTLGRTEDAVVTAETDGKAVRIPYTSAGTVPGTQHIFTQSAAEIRAKVQAAGYGIHADHAGTKPQEAVKARVDAIAVDAAVRAAGFKVPHPETSKDRSMAGTMPGAQVLAEKAIGGIVPIIETASYTVKYTLCGTEITKSSR